MKWEKFNRREAKEAHIKKEVENTLPVGRIQMCKQQW